MVLHTIGKAVKEFHNVHNGFPEWHSDLHPKYLTDTSSLFCPADKDNGKSTQPFNQDPKMKISYEYQFHPKYKKEKSEQRLCFGDVIPLVRCRHNKNQGFERLNLSFSYKVYASLAIWESRPEDMYETIENTITSLESALIRIFSNRSS